MVHQPVEELKGSKSRGKKGKHRGKGGKEGETRRGDNVEWSCSSSFFYVVQGQEEGEAAPQEVNATLRRHLRELAKQLKESETPSTMP